MKKIRMLLCSMSLVLLTVPALIVRAADKPAAPAAGTVAVPDARVAWERRIKEYTSDNLPLSEVVQFLREQFPEINFMIKTRVDEPKVDPNNPNSFPDIHSFIVPITRVRAVTLQEFLQILELATDHPIQVTGKPGDRLVVFEYRSAPVPVETVETRVFSVARYLNALQGKEAEMALAQVEDVVAQTGDMLNRARNGNRGFHPELKFHRGTKLLIAVGRPDELQVIDQVVKELQGGAVSSTVTANSERDSKAKPEAGGSRRW